MTPDDRSNSPASRRDDGNELDDPHRAARGRLGEHAPPFDVDISLAILDSANPPTLSEDRRRRLAAELVSLAAGIHADILSNAEADARAAYAANVVRKATELKAMLEQGQHTGGTKPPLFPPSFEGDLAHWKLEETAFTPYYAVAPGRREKGDERAYGLLLSFYEAACGRKARRDANTLAFLRSFMEAAGPALDDAETRSPHAPSGKTAGRRWRPITKSNFHRRFQTFAAAKVPYP